MRTLVMLASLLLVGLHAPPLARAQDCDPAQPVLFSFDGSTPIVALSVQDLVSRSGKLLQGRGEIQFDDEQRMSLTVRARLSKQRITYTVEGVQEGTRVRATVVTEGCRSTVSRVQLRLRTPTLSGKITDPALVGLAGVMKPGVVIVDEQSVGGLALGTNGTFTLPAADPLAQKLDVGKRVVAVATAATPEGMLVEITGVDDDGSTTTYSSQPVALGDAFETLDIAFGEPDDGAVGAAASAAAAAGGAPGRRPVRMRFDGEFRGVGRFENGSFTPRAGLARPQLTVGKTFNVPFPSTTLRDDQDNRITVGGNLRLEPQVTIDLKLKGPCFLGVCAPCPVPGCKAEGKFVLDGDATLNLQASAIQGINIVGAKHEFPGVTFAVISLGWITFTPEFQPSLGITARASGTASMTARVSGGLRIGAECSSVLPLFPACSPIWDLRASTPSATASFSGDVSVEPYVKGKLIFKVYGVAGPYVAPKLFATGTVPSSGRWKVAGGVKLGVGIIEFKVWELVKFGLGEKEFTLFEGTLDQGSSPVPTPGPTSVPTPAPTAPPSWRITWCGHQGGTVYGPVKRCYEESGSLAYIDACYPLIGTCERAEGPYQSLDANSYVIPATGTDGAAGTFYGGPMISTIFGGVSYGEQRFSSGFGSYLRFGSYNFLTRLFYPSSDWMPDKG